MTMATKYVVYVGGSDVMYKYQYYMPHLFMPSIPVQ